MVAVSDAIAAASSEAIVRSGSKFGTTNPAFPFLDAMHPLVINSPADFIDKCIKTPSPCADHVYVADYLALSSSAHLLEGWRYLSQAAYSMLTGASSAHVHFSYYAELRAARSLLASSGIFVGNKRHCAIEKSGNLVPIDTIQQIAEIAYWRRMIASQLFSIGTWISKNQFRRSRSEIGTHVAAWEAMKAWVNHRTNGERVADSLNALKFRGYDWAEVCRSTQSKADVTANWLGQWSIDLRTMQKDSTFRNIASYGVDVSVSAMSPATDEAFTIISDANEACLSQDNGDVDGIDIMLLNDFCVKSAQFVLKKKIKDSRDHNVWDLVQDGLKLAGSNDPDAKEISDFLKDAPQSSAGRIIRNASISGPGGIFSRALLLLRLATSLHKSFWSEISILCPGGRAPWQTSWLRRFAQGCHLTPTLLPTIQFIDLEQDMADAVDQWNAWRLAATPFSAVKAWEEVPEVLRQLCRFERVALWESDL